MNQRVSCETGNTPESKIELQAYMAQYDRETQSIIAIYASAPVWVAEAVEARPAAPVWGCESRAAFERSWPVRRYRGAVDWYKSKREAWIALRVVVVFARIANRSQTRLTARAPSQVPAGDARSGPARR